MARTRKTTHPSKQGNGSRCPKGVSDETMMDALEKSGGFLSNAAAMLGVSAANISQRLSRKPELKQRVQDIKERYIDLAEIKLLELIRKGNLGAICFFLKCQGKERGWVEKQYVEGKFDHGEGKIKHEHTHKIEEAHPDGEPGYYGQAAQILADAIRDCGVDPGGQGSSPTEQVH
jgi:hypothetical protein